MRYKTKEVEQYQTTYKVFDKHKKKFCASYQDLCEAADYCESKASVKIWNIPRISYTMKWEADYSVTNYIGSYTGCGAPRKYEKLSYPAPKYVILTEFGDVVSEAEIKSARRQKYVYKPARWGNLDWEQECYNRDSRLVYKKGSNRKIKATYRKVLGGFGVWGRHFGFEVGGYYRPVRSHSEMKYACAHAQEYGDEMVRAKRRYKNLPNSYDDYKSDVWDTQKSWKHNSKRRKQWVPK